MHHSVTYYLISINPSNMLRRFISDKYFHFKLTTDITDLIAFTLKGIP